MTQDNMRNVARISILSASLLLTGCVRNSERPQDPSVGQVERSILSEQEARRAPGDNSVPRRSEAHYLFMRGEIALNAEKYDEALDYFRQASTYETGAAPSLRKRLAQIYVKKGELADALKELERASKGEPKDAEVLEQRAGILATLKQTDAAIEAYRQLIALTPDAPNEEAYILLASLLADSGDYAQAKTVLNELLTRSKGSIFGTYYLARVIELSGDLKQAEEYYRKAMALSPESDSIKLDLARILGLQRKFKEGALICEEMLKENDQNAPARQLLGQLLLGDNRVNDALKQFEALRDSESGDSIDARFRIALIKLERREFPAAEQELNLVLAKSPENKLARYYLALAYAGQGKTDDAVVQIRELSEKDRFFKESRMLGAFLLRQERKPAEALDLVRQLRSVEETNPKYLTLLAAVEREAGKIQDAIATVLSLIALEPTQDEHLFLLGVLHDEAGESDKAVAAMEKCVTMNPKNAQALNYLGYTIADRGGDLARAESLVKQALQIEAGNGYYLDSLAWIYYKMGKFTDARREIEKAVAVVSSDAVILEHMAIILARAGETAKAVDTARKALGLAPMSDDKEVGSRLEQFLTTHAGTIPPPVSSPPAPGATSK
ncbi:MAG: tetratricopeptide repeat protein [Deltaproteobacteria bacterium]|nr:tetratricopeptide repeat protein [Deltaproteobacteria bacterium]